MKQTLRASAMTLAVLSIGLAATATAAWANIVITPDFDTSVTAAQQAVINQAIGFY